MHLILKGKKSMWTKYSTAPNLISAEMWKNTIESEGLPCKILPENQDILDWSENSNFAIIDAGMNDLMRPSLYSSWHNVSTLDSKELEEKIYQVVGPVCESADSLAKDRALKVEEGSLLAIHDVGAYGYVMSSNYNTQPLIPEVVVEGNQCELTRRRQTLDDMLREEEDL